MNNSYIFLSELAGTHECWPSCYVHNCPRWTALSRGGNRVCFPYLGCCWLTDDHPAWALLVAVVGDGDVGSPLIEEAFGSVNATVFDAGHLLKFLAYSIAIMEITPAGFICQEKPKRRNHKTATCLWLSCWDLITLVVHLLVQSTGKEKRWPIKGAFKKAHQEQFILLLGKTLKTFLTVGDFLLIFVYRYLKGWRQKKVESKNTQEENVGMGIHFHPWLGRKKANRGLAYNVSLFVLKRYLQNNRNSICECRDGENSQVHSHSDQGPRRSACAKSRQGMRSVRVSLPHTHTASTNVTQLWPERIKSSRRLYYSRPFILWLL